MSIGRTSLLLAPLAAGARGVAFFVPVFIARWYGVQSATDAFYWALSVPTFLLILGSTTMGTVLVPVLAKLRADAPEEVPGFVGTAALQAAILVTLLGAAVALAAPAVLPFATRFDAPTRDLTVQFTWYLLPFLAINAVNAVLKATCEVHGQFAGPAGSPVLRAAVTLAVVWLLRRLGPVTLPAGVVAGTVAEALWFLAILGRAGIRPRLSITPHPALARAARAFGPVLGGEAMVALNLLVDKLFAGHGAAGSVSLLEYADRARMIPQTLLESTLVVVAFNAWSAARARGEDEGRHRAVATALWWVCLLAPPVLGGMAVGRVALIRLLYEHGAFDPAHTLVTAEVLGAFLPGVFFSLIGALVVKAHIVEGRYRLVFGLGALSFTLNAVLNALLMPKLGLAGLAWATSITTFIVTVTSFTYLLPSLKSVFPSSAVRDAMLLATASAGLAIGAAALAFSPSTFTDSALWVASVPFFGLLGMGVLRVRRAP